MTIASARPLRPLLVFRHEPWEGPHRILDAFAGVPVTLVDVLEGEPVLPAPHDVCAAVSMGGPMSANDSDRLPGLATEMQWLAAAHAAGVPLLGVCLGSQLIARALGATVRRAPATEIGFSPLELLDDEDPLMAALGDGANVLHWHGEVFELPPGAVALARSGPTPLQAYRAGDSTWGLLCHPEADAALIELWLDEPSMAAEAAEELGEGYAQLLSAGAAAIDPAPGARLFEAFARHARR